jgi:hypothetical protein
MDDVNNDVNNKLKYKWGYFYVLGKVGTLNERFVHS